MKRLVILSFAMLSVWGCSHGEATDCSKYVSQLELMVPGQDDPKQLFEHLSEHKCQSAVGRLGPWLTENDGMYGGEVMRLVKALWNPDARTHEEQSKAFASVREDYVALLRAGLKNPDLAVLVADLVAIAGIAELRDDLLGLLSEVAQKDVKRQFERAYARSLLALGVMSDAEMAEYKGLDSLNDIDDTLLVALLSRSSDRQDVDANKRAAIALGKKKSSSPDAIRALIRGLFVANGAARSESLDAILRIGAPAVPFLIDVMGAKPGSEEIRYMEEFAMTNSLDEWKWREGIWVRMLLAQIADERAAAVFIADMGMPVIAPVGMPKGLEEEWHRTQGNRFKFDSWGLMSTMHAGVAEAALKILRDKTVEVQARLNLALGLAFNFTPAATDALFRTVYNPPSDRDSEDEEELNGDKWKLEPAFRADFVVPFMEPLTYSMRYSDLARFQEVFVDGFEEYFGDQDKPELIQEKLEDVDTLVILGVLRHCKEDRDCYMKICEGAVPVEVFNPETAAEKYEGAFGQRERDYFNAMARTKATLVLSRWTAGKHEERQKVIEQVAAIIRANLYDRVDRDDAVYEDFRRALFLVLERYGRESTRLKSVVMTELASLLNTGKPLAQAHDALKPWVQRIEALQLQLESFSPEAARSAKEETPSSAKTAAPQEEPAEVVAPAE
jgi:hypothetical protein